MQPLFVNNLCASFFLLKTSGKLRLDFLNGRQNGFQVVRQGPGQLVFGDADGFVQAAQGVFRLTPL
jgi:hypothetical protein